MVSISSIQLSSSLSSRSCKWPKKPSDIDFEGNIEAVFDKIQNRHITIALNHFRTSRLWLWPCQGRSLIFARYSFDRYLSTLHFEVTSFVLTSLFFYSSIQMLWISRLSFILIKSWNRYKKHTFKIITKFWVLERKNSKDFISTEVIIILWDKILFLLMWNKNKSWPYLYRFLAYKCQNTYTLVLHLNPTQFEKLNQDLCLLIGLRYVQQQ